MKLWEKCAFVVVAASAAVLIVTGFAYAYGWNYGLDLFWWIRR